MGTEIGERIKTIRGSQTQQEFADLIGVGRTTLIRYEAGERMPDAEFLIKLNVLYSIQPLWLLTGKGDDVLGVKLKPDEAAFLDNYRHSPKDAQESMKTMCAALAQSAGAVKKGKAA